MKIMDKSMESEDCTIAATVPPKTKKLKQARLPFQNLGSPVSPNTLSNKKRKHMSPSPTAFRSPKIVKITTKENAEQLRAVATKTDKNKPTESIQDAQNDSIRISETTSENSVDEISIDETQTKDKKVDVKSQDKPGAIRKFLQIIPAKEEKKDFPIVLLTRCDPNDGETSGTDLTGEVEEKPEITKEDDSRNEELAKRLEDSEAEDDGASKDKSDASSDDAGANTDTESDKGITSSDDETDDQKKMNDVENSEKTANEMGLDKTPTSGVKVDGAIVGKRKLTPKQLEKKMNSSKLREERKKLKLEREKQREEERLNRQKEKEAREREKKEKEEQKRKEKEQKELKKQMEIEQKQKEKERRDKAKEEDRRKREEAREEEKRKKEEEKLESERKKQKAASTFVSFFVPKKAETKVVEDEKIVATSNFMPFEVKADMRVAPICRRTLDDVEKIKFDQLCVDKAKKTADLYVAEIKKDRRSVRKSGKTWPPESKEDDIVVIEEDDVGSCNNMVDENNTGVEKHRAKLLAFAENRRPPYWGTWRKQSSAVTPRRPFSKDTKWFDYEVDSDEEWEEEEPGESLRGSDDEKDEENPDDNEYDVDNEFMVPHGYLSDEEAQADEDEEDMSPETQKLKLKILGAEFEEERKTQTSKIKPRVIGPIWQGPDNSYPENIPQKLVEFLMARQAWTRETPINLTPPETNVTNASENAGGSKTHSAGEDRRGPKKKKLPAEALPELIRLIHGNPHGLNFLTKEFMTFWNRKNRKNEIVLSKSSILQKIREFAKRIACPEEGPMHLRACWYVSEETRKDYLGEERLTLPNNWSYALTPRRKTHNEISEIVEKTEKDEKDKKNVPLITQYAIKITQEEMKKQLTVKPSQSSNSKSATLQSKPPKRATLISVGRGEQFPQSSIIHAFSRPTASTVASVSTNDSPIVDPIGKSTTTEPIVIDLDSDNSD